MRPGLVCIGAVVLLCQFAAMGAAARERAPDLEVRADPSGGVRARATLVIPAPPSIVQEILTDFPKWPELFAVKMRLAHLEWREGRAITDFYIRHAFLPAERRLLCESEILPNGGLITKLLGGDFKRYQRTWTLAPESGGRHTRAEFDLVVEVDTVAPDWLIAFTLRRELETHFRILKESAMGRAQQGS